MQQCCVAHSFALLLIHEICSEEQTVRSRHAPFSYQPNQHNLLHADDACVLFTDQEQEATHELSGCQFCPPPVDDF